MRLLRRKRAANPPEPEERFELWLTDGSVIAVADMRSLATLINLLREGATSSLDNVVLRIEGPWRRRELSAEEIVALMDLMEKRSESRAAVS